MLGKCFFLSFLTASALCFAGSAADPLETLRAEGKRQQDLGNYLSAIVCYRRLALEPTNPVENAMDDLHATLFNHSRLGREDLNEPLLVEMYEVWKTNWRMLAALAKHQLELPELVRPEGDGYVRASHWGQINMNARERDRVRALQLMMEAEALLPGDISQEDARWFYDRLAEIIGYGRIDSAAWRFTSLTDITTLPEPEDYSTYYSRGERGAPVDENGNPVFYRVPENWASAANDGERWRWALSRVAAAGGHGNADFQYASFLLSQFGVQTMGSFAMPRSDDQENETGVFAVRTLTDSETIARLATGIKRFTLPEEHNFIALFHRAADGTGYALEACRSLAMIFENRQQYAKAARQWERVVPSAKEIGNEAMQALRRITGKNGVIEAGPTMPAGQQTSLSYLFRNGSLVHMKAEKLDEKKLLAEITKHVRENTFQRQRNNQAFMRPEYLGRQIVEKDNKKYIVETTAQWDVPLTPLPDHLSSRISIALPFTQAGCYLITATMQGGNQSRCIVWLADLALSSKTVAGKQIWFAADAVSGQPVDATISFYGYGAEQGKNTWKTTVFAEKTDANGLVVIPQDKLHNQQWLTIAESNDGKLAYSGFDYMWTEPSQQDMRPQRSAYIITDRPIYRPGQKVQYKIWVGLPSYAETQPALAPFSTTVEIRNPRGETVRTESVMTDEYCGIAGELTLDKNAVLGAYSISLSSVNGGGTFFLEEYKKPEYEVTVETPDAAIQLGDTAFVTLGARYYFGAPVVNADVSYTITRTPYTNPGFNHGVGIGSMGAVRGNREQASTGLPCRPSGRPCRPARRK